MYIFWGIVGEDWVKGGEKLYKEIIVDNFFNFEEDVNIYELEVYRILNKYGLNR